ncbi:MAG TPA: alpha/beta hydrolase [Candidatus Acidoferrales bacterium]|nr:alpha/beta hydrolase [Candidatus Acidoferrales bacterium]
MLDWRTRLYCWFVALSGRGFRPGISVDVMRAGYAAGIRRFGMPPVGGVTTSTLAIPARDGAQLEAHLHRPEGVSGALPVLLYFHGGGCTIGDVACYDNLTRFFAREGKIAVLNAEYRLGPEHRFPTAVEDAFDALGWLQREAASLQLDPSRIAVGGDSAGGGLSATLSAFAVANGLVRPVYQLLIYPPLDFTERFPSRKKFATGTPLTLENRKWFLHNYLRSEDDRMHPWLRQIDAPEPELLPPTYVQAGGYDAYVDEERYYADRLRAARVPVVFDLRPSLAHGYANLAGIVPEARRALRDAIAATAGALRR